MRLREPEEFRGQVAAVGTTLAGLARTVGVTRQFVGDIADGAGTSPEIAAKIEDALGMSTGSLFTDTPRRSHSISVRLNDDEYDRVLTHAEEKGTTISAVIVDALNRLWKRGRK